MHLFSRNKQHEVEITISNRTVVRVLLLIIISFLLLSAARQASHALSLIFIAFFLSLALNAPVHWIAQRLPGRKRGSRSLATTVSFLLVIAFLGVFLFSIVPPLVRQTATFIEEAPGLVDDIRDENSSLGSFVRRNGLEDQVDKLSGQVSSWVEGLSTSAVSTVTKVTSSIVAMLTVLVLTFMMLTEGPRWSRFARRLLPDDKEAHAEKLVHDMNKVIRGYVNGQVLLAAIAAVLIAPPLFILGISYPLALMVVVFICGLIPMVGHTIGAVIVSLVALFTSPWAALIILIYYITYQQIENYAIQPRIQANSTDMSPLLVFSSVIIGVSLNGLVGGLVAIPIAGCLRILVLDYLMRKNYLEPATVKAITTPKKV
ncbi:AI-2E family transporter [Candidatus Saccharibacteria bacterium]|nr:AI-2E family transporter [Candidatus Saccharibacteria bacterium]